MTSTPTREELARQFWRVPFTASPVSSDSWKIVVNCWRAAPEQSPSAQLAFDNADFVLALLSERERAAAEALADADQIAAELGADLTRIVSLCETSITDERAHAALKEIAEIANRALAQPAQEVK